MKLKLEELKTEHRDLDIAIDALVSSGNINAFQLQLFTTRSTPQRGLSSSTTPTHHSCL